MMSEFEFIHDFQDVLIYARIVGYIVMIWALFVLAVRHKERNVKMFWAMLSMAGFHAVLMISLVAARVGTMEIATVRMFNDLGLTPFLFTTTILVLVTIRDMDREYTRTIERKVAELRPLPNGGENDG